MANAIPLQILLGISQQLGSADMVLADGIVPRSGSTLTFGDGQTSVININGVSVTTIALGVANTTVNVPGRIALGAGTINTPAITFGTATVGLYGIGGSETGYVSSGVLSLNFSSAGLRATVGSAATPSLSFVGYTDDGFFHPAGAGAVFVTIGGASRWSFGSADIPGEPGALWARSAPGKIGQYTTGAGLTFSSAITTQAVTGIAIDNGGVGFTAGVASAAADQVSLGMTHAVVQGSTSSFVAQKIDLTGAGGAGAPTFGSGGGFFFDFRTNSASVAKMTAAGQIQVGSGGAAAPGLSFTADTTKGWYHAGASVVNLALAGASALALSGSSIQYTWGSAANYLFSSFAGSYIDIGGAAGTASTNPTVVLRSQANFDASAVQQTNTLITSPVAQTSTAGFTALKIAMFGSGGAGAPTFGSGGGKFLDLQTNSTSIASVTSPGAFLSGDGDITNPGRAWNSDPGFGWYKQSATRETLAVGGVTQFGFQTGNGVLQFFVNSGGIASAATNGNLTISGVISSTNVASIDLLNDGAFTGGAASAQIHTRLSSTVAQGGAAGAAFTALQFATTHTSPGTGNQLAIDFHVGGVSQAHISSAGHFRLADGLVATPSLSFASTTGLGFFRGSASEIRIAQGGLNIFGLDANGPTLNFYQNGTTIYANVSHGYLQLAGLITTSLTPAMYFKNGAQYSAAAGAQTGTHAYFGVNQTGGSTASFTGSVIDLCLSIVGTGTPVFGTNGGFFFDYRVANSSIAKMTSAGALLSGAGTTALPSLSFLAEPALGLRRAGAQQLAVVSGGVDTWLFANATLQAPLVGVLSANFNTTLSIDTNTNSGGGGLTIRNGQVYNGAGTTAQFPVSITAGVNQTVDASFTALKIDLGLVVGGTGVPVFGSGGGFFYDFRANSVSVSKMTSTGQFLAADGGISTPTYSFASSPTEGIMMVGGVMIAAGGAYRWRFSSNIIQAFTQSSIIQQAVAEGNLSFGGMIGGNADTSVNLFNVSIFTGAAGIAQVGTRLAYGVNQTSTASFTALKIDLGNALGGTGAPVFGGSGANGKFLDFRANSVSVSTMDSAGRLLVGPGTAGAPSLGFLGTSTTGFSMTTSGIITVATPGGGYTTFRDGGISYTQNTGYLGSAGINGINSIDISGGVTSNSAVPSIVLSNHVAASTAYSAFVGSNTVQRGLELQWPVVQSSTASFTGILMDIRGASYSGAPTFGSGGGKFFDYQSNSVSISSMNTAGELLVGLGSASSPSYSFAGDPDTGVYRNDTNEIGFSTGGTACVRITSSSFGPFDDNTIALGAATKRFSDVFAVQTTIGDLNMRDPDSGAGDREASHWKIVEGADCIYAYNIRTGQKFKIALETTTLDEADTQKIARERARFGW